MKRVNWIFGSAIFLLLFIILFELMSSDDFDNWFAKFTAEKAAAVQANQSATVSSSSNSQTNYADTINKASLKKEDTTDLKDIDIKQVNHIGDSIKKQITEIVETQQDLKAIKTKSGLDNKTDVLNTNKISKIDVDKSTKAAIQSIVRQEANQQNLSNAKRVVTTKEALTKPVSVEKSELVVSTAAPNKKSSTERKMERSQPATATQLVSPKQSVSVARSASVTQPELTTQYATPYQPNIKPLPAPPIQSDGTLSRKITKAEIDEFIRQFPDKSLNIQFVNFGSIDAEMENVKAQITYELERYSYTNINKGWNQMSGYVLTDEVHFASNGSRGVIVYIPPLRRHP